MKLIKHILFLSLVFGNSNVTAMEDDRLGRHKLVNCEAHIAQVRNDQQTTQKIVSNEYMARVDQSPMSSDMNDLMSQLPIELMLKITEYLPKEELLSLALCSKFYRTLVKQSSSVIACFSNIVNESELQLLYRYVLLCPEIPCNIADVLKEITLMDVMSDHGDLIDGLKRIPEFKALLESCEMQAACSVIQKRFADYTQILSWHNVGENLQDVLTFLPTKLMRVNRFTEINLRRGQLLYVSNVNALRFLTKIDLSHNKFSNLSFLQGLSNLKWLDLSYNEITQLPDLSGLGALEQLDLCYNKLQYVDAIQHLRHLKKLYLSHNPITEIQSMSGLQLLSVLHLYHTQISDFSFVDGLVMISELDISHNTITKMPNMSGLIELRDLNLSHTQLSNISFLKDLVRIRYLNLSNNKIISMQDICGLQWLVHLDLSYNMIKDSFYIERCSNLTRLTISNNRLTTLFYILKLRNLIYLDVSANKFSDFYLVQDMKYLQTLNLSHNSIKRLQDMHELCATLTNLNLSHTQLECASFVQHLSNLRSLNLSNNHLTQMPNMAPLKWLGELYLSGNSLDFSPVDDLSPDCIMLGLSDIEAKFLIVNYHVIRSVKNLLKSNNL